MRLLSALLLVNLVGCGSSSAGSLRPVASAAPPCELSATDPPTTLALGAIVDSSALVADLAERWSPSWGRVAVSLEGQWADLDGADAGTGTEPDETVTVFAELPDSTLGWLRERIIRHRTAARLPEGGASIVVADQGRLAPRTVARLRSCAPYLTGDQVERMRRSLSRVGRQFTEELQHAPLVTHLLIRVDESGKTIQVRVEERSRSAAFDRAASDLARSLRFSPPWVEGRSIPVWIAFPVSITWNQPS